MEGAQVMLLIPKKKKKVTLLGRWIVVCRPLVDAYPLPFSIASSPKEIGD